MELKIAIEKGDLVLMEGRYVLTEVGLWFFSVNEPFRHLVEGLALLNLLEKGILLEGKGKDGNKREF